MDFTIENLPLTFKFTLSDWVRSEEEVEVFHGAITSKSIVLVSWRINGEIQNTTYNIKEVVKYLNEKDWIMEG